MPQIIRQIIPDIHDVLIKPNGSNILQLGSFRGGVWNSGGGLTIAGIIHEQGINTIYTDSSSDYLITCNSGNGQVSIGSTPFSGLTTGYNDGSVLSLYRTDNSSWWNFTSPVVKDYRNSLILSGDLPTPYNVGGSMHTIGQGFHARHVGFCSLGSDRKPGGFGESISDNAERYFAVVSAFENEQISLLKNPGTTGWQTLTQDQWTTLSLLSVHCCFTYGMTIYISVNTLLQNNTSTVATILVQIGNYTPNEEEKLYLANTSSGYSPIMPVGMSGEKTPWYLNQPNYGVVKFRAYPSGGGTVQYDDTATQIIVNRSGKPIRGF